MVTTTRVLSYAKASEMVPTLKKFLSSRGDILADNRSNTLIIRDVPTVLPVLDNLLRQLDRKSQQVEIEARVVAANRSFSREIGTSACHCSRYRQQHLGWRFRRRTPARSFTRRRRRFASAAIASIPLPAQPRRPPASCRC